MQLTKGASILARKAAQFSKNIFQFNAQSFNAEYGHKKPTAAARAASIQQEEQQQE